MKKIFGCIGLLLSFVVAARAERPDWAYPVASTVQPAFSDDGKPKGIPGSTLEFTLTQINNLEDTIDWFPNRHSPPPRAVLHGSGPALACAACHLTSGMGHPESSRLAGLPAAYLERQLGDFKSGDRKDPARMTAIGSALSREDARRASEWFAALKPRPWIAVVETTRIPLSYLNPGRMRLPLPGVETEELGNRIVELPESAERATRRDPNSGFVGYVPLGSVERGKALVMTGGGKTQPCSACHGPALSGHAEVPGIAGGSPLYVARQLFDFQTGTRGGEAAALMKPIAVALNNEDYINVAAYLASLPP